MFTQSETDFPRGNKKRRAIHEKITLKKDEDLFQTHIQESQQRRGTKRKNNKREKDGKKKKYEWEPLELNTSHIQPLNFTSLCPGMLVLGCVKKVEDYRLLVNLPGGHTGAVDVSSISNAFTKILQQMSESEEKLKNLSEDVSSFHEMFYIGMLLRCKILQVMEENGGKRVINLTINPKEIYEHLNLETLKNKMILTTTIISHEDHGYQMDIGISDVQAFLTNKAASKFITQVNKGQSLAVGQYMHCMINMSGPKGCSVSESRIVKLSIDPNKISEAMEAETELKVFHQLYPGMLVSATITNVVEKGLLVSFFSFRGFIHKSHLRNFNQNPENYSVGDKVLGCLLYIYPLTNVVSLSLMPHLCQPKFDPSNKFSELAIGDLVENGKIFAIKESGIYLKFNHFIGFVQKSHLSDKPVSTPNQEFSLEKVCKCRVINFNYLDQFVILSMRESIINQQFFRYEHINVGDFAEGEVKEIIKLGMTLKIGNNIIGFVPHLHLADIPLIHPHKKFKTGDKVKCRVLLVDAEKKRLLLTCKKSLLRKNLAIFSNLETLHRNAIIEGVVVCIKSNGLLVTFFNNVKGWVSRKEMSDEPTSSPESLFYLGQIVKCRVLNALPERRKLSLSLRISKGIHPILKNMDQYKELVGQIFDCKVRSKTKQGLDVILLSSNTPAFIPINYLSDHIAHSRLLWQLQEEGNIIQDCLCFDATRNIILTKKKMLIEAEKNELTVSHFDGIKAGLTLIGVVGNIKQFGIFILFPNGLVGLAPKKLMSDEFIESTSGVFESGQTVVAKVIETNEEKRRFLVGLRLRDCYNGDIEVGLDCLQAFLEEKQDIQHSFSNKDDDMGILCQVAVGSVVMVKITKIKRVILCETESGIQGLVIAEHIFGFDGQIGDEVFAVVLFVDLKNKCLELSLNTNLVKQIKNRKENASSKAAVNQKMKADIVLIKEDFVLVSLALHTQGILAYMPAKRNSNDYLGKERFSLGMNLPVIIKRVVDNLVLVTICSKKHPNEIPLDNVVDKPIKNHNLKLDIIHQATIKKIKTVGLVIEIDRVVGFVHISRIKDNMRKNENVFKGLKKGQEVQVRILNIRNYKKTKSYPITKYFTTGAPLCTMKESQLSASVESSCITKLDINPRIIGHSIPAFFFKFVPYGILMQVDLQVKGILDLLDVSHDIGTIKNVKKVIKPYFCYKPMVREIRKNQFILSLTGLMDLEANMKVCAHVVELLPNSKLIVRLPCGYQGEASLVNLADNYDNMEDVMKVLQPGKLIQAYILSSNKTERTATISIRPSRLHGPLRVEIKDPEVNLLQDLQIGQLLRGFIKNCTAAGLFISLGNGLDSFVPLSHIQRATASKDLKLTFSLGQLVTTKIIRVESTKVISSLIPEDIL